MKTTEIKEKLIKEINLSENKDLLEELYSYLTLENEITETYRLNSEQRAAILKAREQIKNNDYLTDDKANQEVDEWSSRQDAAKLKL